ncbi:MAG: glycosyltransferase, partial [Desulfovibrio sp.]|nr:glycosyltransferase [Desulfovibrio sp.]
HEHEKEAQGPEGAEAAVAQYPAEALARGAAPLGIAHVRKAVPVEAQRCPDREKDPDPAGEQGLSPVRGDFRARGENQGHNEGCQRPAEAEREAHGPEPGKSLLKARGADCRLELLGPPESGLGGVDLAQVRRWEAEGLLEYLGETRDVRPYIAASHVMVLPSWREGTPTSVMEAMSMARPAVVTDVPGCREVVREGVNGWLTPLRAPAALARAMERFVADPAFIARMGAAGREMALEDFDAGNVAARIMRDMGVAAPDAARADAPAEAASTQEKGERP